MAKNTTNRKKHRKNRTIRRKYNLTGSGATASKQSAKPKDMMEELNDLESQKKKMIVYAKLVAIEKVAKGTINIDFTKDPTTMTIKELIASLAFLGIKTTENEKGEIVKVLKKVYKSTENAKVDKVFDDVILRTRERLIKERKEQDEKTRQINLQKQREQEEKKRLQELEREKRAFREEEKRKAEEHQKIAEFDAKIREFEEWDNYYKQREEMSNPHYQSRHYPHYTQNPYQPNPYVSAAMYHAQAQEELNQIPEHLRYGFIGKK